jgi:WD40 repeat protein
VSFSPDGTWLASASANKTVILWKLKEIQNLDEPQEQLEYGCKWVQDYLKYNANESDSEALLLSADRNLCDGLK